MTDIYGTYTKAFKKDCHQGNSLVYTHPVSKAKLWIGGWNQGAIFDWNTHVIDLTGAEHKFWDIPFAYDDASKDFMPFVQSAYAGWLSLPFPDYKTPTNLTTKEQWIGIANVINGILQKGTDVLVACHGGHGRSGLFCAIVGYLLAVNEDRSWASPVEKIRSIHCFDSVETYSQEKYVYDILGLNITIKHVYVETKTTTKSTFLICPICGTSSSYIEEWGMCWNCHDKYKKDAPERQDLTLEDIKHKGEVEHSCTRERCVGIWRASDCGHVTHDMIIYEGLCQPCWDKHEAEKAHAEAILAGEIETQNTNWDACANCEKRSWFADRFGICYECQQAIVEDIDAVHNTITDPYRALPHHCDDVGCVGIVLADVCGHVLHNREVEDGLCPDCLVQKGKYKQSEMGKEWE